MSFPTHGNSFAPHLSVRPFCLFVWTSVSQGMLFSLLTVRYRKSCSQMNHKNSKLEKLLDLIEGVRMILPSGLQI